MNPRNDGCTRRISSGADWTSPTPPSPTRVIFMAASTSSSGDEPSTMFASLDELNTSETCWSRAPTGMKSSPPLLVAFHRSWRATREPSRRMCSAK